MRLILLTILTMIAFAANSVLNRLALTDGAMGPAAFAAIRLGAGAVMLAVLVLTSRRGGMGLFGPGRATGVLSLTLYMLGFSFAYVSLPAGLGALLLFGGVQVTMFAGAVIGGDEVPPLRWLGAGVAFAGLAWLLWPAGVSAPPLVPALLMAAAALGWGIYSLVGRGAADPLQSTAANFLLAAPLAVIVFALRPDQVSAQGMALAVASGAITSGMGYALWYAILPSLGASRAAVAQLTVPIIAMAGGMAFLAEPLTTRFVIAAALVLGGVGVSLMRR
ncbi:DMT family transporter [Actibacterium sp. XHP0104]|uniref:DMT family transporter n=1 Tax=Actibacterium sp. XHP0104 TaxID=2984335 RepID=UPI0021E9432F|nr:DMT family transporter [Actibacterium sp. XHP0104]MCV2882254.1 DMT family transporter [Actibacterium sp. XHP0104]